MSAPTSIPTQIPYVGVGAVIVRGQQLLLMKRSSVMGHQSWSPPGGYLEFGESFAACAAREASEEVGYAGGVFSFLAVTNDIFDGRHFVTVWMRSVADAGWDPGPVSDEVLETGWFKHDALPQPLFRPFANLTTGLSDPAQAFARCFEA